MARRALTSIENVENDNALASRFIDYWSKFRESAVWRSKYDIGSLLRFEFTSCLSQCVTERAPLRQYSECSKGRKNQRTAGHELTHATLTNETPGRSFVTAVLLVHLGLFSLRRGSSVAMHSALSVASVIFDHGIGGTVTLGWSLA